MNITILYGTETGNAEMLAEDLAAHLATYAPKVRNLAEFDPDDFAPATFYIVVCSTYGEGELPASAKPFAQKMAVRAPDLTGMRFAVFGMGDSEYPQTFNFGGKQIEEILRAAGATLLGARVTHDASGPDLAEDLAFPWADGVLQQAEGEA